jgi:uncharacterized protein (DUF433 family)
MMHDRIVSDPDIMVGKPAVRVTRITVELILRQLGHGQTVEDLIDDYPSITRDDILAAQAFAAAGQGKVGALREAIRKRKD